MSTTKLHRIQVKAFLKESPAIDPAALIPVFHKWIQQGPLEELLIDVANYEHVPDGPAVMLIAHEADYALDRADGRPGLLYTRKRDLPDGVGSAVGLALRRLFSAARLLEEERSLGGRCTFRTDEIEIRFLDRLNVRNEEASLHRIRDEVVRSLTEFYGVDGIDLERVREDERLPLKVRATIESAPSISELSERAAFSG